MINLPILLIFLFVVFVLIFIYLLKEKKKPIYNGYILKDLIVDDFKPVFKNNEALTYFARRYLGKVVICAPPDHVTKVNPTVLPGGADRIYYSLCFQIPKDEFLIQKFDEYLEVSPVHAQYYQITMRQKEDLENKIKAGLTSAAQAIADYELIAHDLRKYEEFKKYIEEKDEKSLKAIFVDQVDYYSGGMGEGPGRLSLSFMQQKNIMPTIVQDFYEMSSEEDLEKNPRFKDIPTVEKSMLRTKWRAYQTWKSLFVKEVESRYKRIKELHDSRKKSIEEYRNWLKPYIARHMILKEGFSRPEVRKREPSFFAPAAEASVINVITLWAWKWVTLEELKRVPEEFQAMKPIPADDEWTRKELIFDRKKGLAAEYPWITPSWVNKAIKEIYSDGWMKKSYLYYQFFVIQPEKRILKFADGTEIEDIDWWFRSYLFSQNVMLVKLLELKAKQEEINRYIDSLLGISQEEDIESFILRNIDNKDVVQMAADKFQVTKDEVKKIIKQLKGPEKSVFQPIRNFFDFFEIPLMFFNRGPYETNLSYRISKFFLSPMGAKLDSYKKLVLDRAGWGK